jgi:UDP-GlcNAc3NAcA epimerase
MPHIVTVVGARPQFVKAATVSRVLPTLGVRETLVHTGQHFDDSMSKVFFDELGIPEPAVNLHLGGLSHGALTGRMIEALEHLYLDEKPDAVLVYGDTTSTLAGALAAVKLHIPIAHVEAGLRSFNRRMPEEINRLLTDQVSEWLYAPTPTAVENLRREGIAEQRIHLVGDVMYDATLLFSKVASQRSHLLRELGIEPSRYVLATIHREENTDNAARLAAILEALEEHASDEPVVLPLHPRTRKRLIEYSLAPTKIRIIDPVGYLDMIELERNARIIATDSGGVQKEAYFLRVPCVTLRDETEWVELIEAGWNRLAPPHSASAIRQAFLKATSGREEPIAAYGTGCAAQTIGHTLSTALGRSTQLKTPRPARRSGPSLEA